jgi:hypothetical protein
MAAATNATAASSAASDAGGPRLSADPERALSIAELQEGWKGEFDAVYSYWVPGAQIEGKIPDDLIGTVFKNGPGVLRVYDKELVHPIDGDGMVCAITFTADGVHFRNRFVESKSHKEEKRQHKFIYRGQMGTQVTHFLLYSPFSQNTHRLCSVIALLCTSLPAAVPRCGIAISALSPRLPDFVLRRSALSCSVVHCFCGRSVGRSAALVHLRHARIHAVCDLRRRSS